MRTLLFFSLALVAVAAEPIPTLRRPATLAAAHAPKTVVPPPSAAPADTPETPDDRDTAPAFVNLAPPRTVPYSPQDIISVNTHLRFITVIILPMGEKVVDAYCGDSDFWKVDTVENLIYVKPTKARISTDLTLLTKSGTLYTFYLREVDDLTIATDAKVTVSFNDPQRLQTASTGPRFVSKTEVDNIVQDYQQQIADKENKARQIKQAADNALTQMRLDYPAQLAFDYNVALNTPPFFVTAIYADNRFTYIRLDAKELPAIYELKDGKPSILQYDFLNGTYILRKIVDQGYLMIGKAKLSFSRKTK